MRKESPTLESPASSKRTSGPAVATGPSLPSENNTVSQVAIMVRANEKWVAAGMPKGNGNHFWLEAEGELRREAAEQTEHQGGA